MDRVAAYTQTFRPFRSRYVVESEAEPVGELFAIPEKETRRGYLSNARIERALSEREYVATFAGTHYPDVFGLDVDDHDRPPSYVLTAHLLDTYSEAIAALGTIPSLLFQTPRGLHAYWLLTERLPYAAIRELVLELIGSVPVEFRPTPSEAIRIPSEHRSLRPNSLQPTGIPLPQLLARAERYAPVDLFDEIGTREGYRAHRRRSGGRRSLDMYRIEAETIPLCNGRTYEAVTRLLIAYRGAGLAERAAAWRFRDVVLRQSPGYAGDLHNPRIIDARVRYFWNNRQSVTIRPRSMQATLGDSLVAAEIVKRLPFAPQRNRPIERFIMALLATDRYHRGLVIERNNLSDLALWKWLYRHYERSVRRGYIPLPYEYLRKLNNRYNDIIPWLVELGFMQPLDVSGGRTKRGSYRAANLGAEHAYCRHYRINAQPFSTEGF